MASPLRMPVESLRRGGRHLLPLAFFYSAGRLVHDLILLVAAYTSDVEGPRKYVGFAVMSLAVLATSAAPFRSAGVAASRPRRRAACRRAARREPGVPAP